MQLFDIEDRAPVPPARPVIVNGQEISRAAIAREIQNHRADNADSARRMATEALVVRELLLQEAVRLAIKPDTDTVRDGLRETEEEALIRAVLESQVQTPRPTRKECQRFYQRNLERFRNVDLHEVSHVLLSCDPSDQQALGRAKARAIIILGLLESRAITFREAAQTYSDCPSAEKGGNLGQIGPGQTVPEFEQALSEMSEGEVLSKPVKSSYGVHIIALHRTIQGQALLFEVVEKRISDYLADAVFHRAVHQYVAILAGRAEISGIDIERPQSPLVQ